jgi:BlaR1 peptidase M56
MNADTIACLNYMVHSLVIGAAAWLLVWLVIRDALRRCILANLAVLMCLYTPFNIGMQDLLPQPKEEVPVWTPIRETFKADWRLSVAPAKVLTADVASQVPRWDVDDVVRGLRWLAWMIAGVLLMRLLYQSVCVQMWAWRLRRPTREEEGFLRDRVLGCSNTRKLCTGVETFESSRGLEHSRTLSRVRVHDGVSGPCVAGWFFPVIAVPASAFETLTPREWGWLLRHEAEHLRMHDTVAVLLQNVVRSFLWWNPFVHALMEDYARAREVMCDAAAVGEEREPTAYADFLLAWAAKPGAQQACVMPMAYSRPARRLKARLVALMEARGVRKKVGALFVLMLAAFAVIAPVVASSFGIATAAAQEAVKADKDDGAMHTRVYVVAPNFLSLDVVPHDPFTQHQAATPLASRKTARQLLEAKGVTFPAGASVSYQPATSQLIVKNTSANLKLMEQIIDKLHTVPAMVYFNCKLIQADEFLGKHESVLSAEEAGNIVRMAAQKKGVHLLSSPELTTRFDQAAIVEVLREAPPGELAKGKASDEVKFIGLRIELMSKAPSDGKSLIDTTVHLGGDPESDTPWLAQEGQKVDWDKVRMHAITAKRALASGETLLLHLPTSKRPVTVLITATALHADGSKAGSFAATMTKAPPASQGRDVPEEEIKKKEAWGEREYRVPAGFGEGKKPVEYLQSKGVVFPQGASALIANSRLIVRNTKENLELIEFWLGQVKKRVVVSVKAVEMKGDFLELLKEWVPPPPDAPKPAVVTDPTLLVPAAAPPAGEILRPFTTAAVFSASQFETVMKKIAHAPVKIDILRLDDKSKKYKQPDTKGGLEATVESAIGADGNTIELIITVDGVNRPISTGVTLWDGQTVVLGAQPSDHLTRFLFITANMVEEEKKK